MTTATLTLNPESLRALVANLSDDTIRSVIDTLVRALLQGVIDELADNIVEALVDQLAAAGHAAERAEPASAPTETPTTATTDAPKRTCEICGRVGTRRYIPIGDHADNRWRCSPTATACIGNQPEPAVKVPNPALSHDLDTPAPPGDEQRHTPAAGITARCANCPRTWTLTGRILTQAVDMHEMKHSHIVDVEEGADA